MRANNLIKKNGKDVRLLSAKAALIYTEKTREHSKRSEKTQKDPRRPEKIRKDTRNTRKDL